MLVSIAGSAVFLAAFAAADSLAMLFVFRTLHGMCAANISTAQAYVADVTTPENRAMGMGLIGASFGVGMSLGPFIGGEMSVFGLAAPIWLAAGLSAINFVWAFFGLPESTPVGRKGQNRRTLDPRVWMEALGHPVIGLAIGLTFVQTFAFSMMESTFALVAEHAWAMDAQGVGRLFGVIGIIGIVIQGGLIGRLVKRFGERTLIGVGYAANSIGLAWLAFTEPGWGIYIGCTFVAVGISIVNPSLAALISRAAHANDQGKVLGANQSLSALARALAPALGGWLFAAIFPGAAFLTGAALMAVALILSIPAIKRIQTVV
jgi:MFS family permease